MRQLYLGDGVTDRHLLAELAEGQFHVQRGGPANLQAHTLEFARGKTLCLDANVIVAGREVRKDILAFGTGRSIARQPGGLARQRHLCSGHCRSLRVSDNPVQR